MALLQFIPNAASKNGVTTLTLDDVPTEVRTEVEEVYTALKTQPGRMRATFETLDAMNLYISQVKTYCDLRTVNGKPAPIRFRKSPSRGLPKTTMDFRITDLQTENEAEVESIRDAVDAVKTAAKR